MALPGDTNIVEQGKLSDTSDLSTFHWNSIAVYIVRFIHIAV